ncbi:unnamed protein product [Lupinus luteus]|uniref:Formin-like protein n=1 Tax=Lupinus luteus TaxID=3873 RepID=A0AAV1YGL1_LUPLU
MALFRKFFYKKPPDGLLEISERVYVFDYCFTAEVMEEDEHKGYIEGIIAQLHGHFPDASYMVFNMREGESPSHISNILSDYDMMVIDYPRQYEGCPLLTMEMIHHFLKSGENWVQLGRQNLILMHCERGGWAVLAFMLAAFLIYRKQFTGEQKTLDMIYKQAPRELLQLMSPLNPLPSQLRYLQYISRRNVGSEWPPLDRALTLDCVIIRLVPKMDGEGGCRPIFRIYGQDPFMAADRTPKVLFSTPKRSKLVRYYKQADCELVKIDIDCHVQGDVVLECISLDSDLERENMMFRVMFNTAFIRSNILMLNRDEIDILWNTKDNFPKNFRVEALFSDMEASSSVIPMNMPCIGEKEGLPVEAFAKVKEMFNNVDWIDSNTEVANVLQQITASNILLERLDSGISSPTSKLLRETLSGGFKLDLKSQNNMKSSPSAAHRRSITTFESSSYASMEKIEQFESKALPENYVKPLAINDIEPSGSKESMENDTNFPTSMVQGKQSIPFIEPSMDTTRSMEKRTKPSESKEMDIDSLEPKESLAQGKQSISSIEPSTDANSMKEKIGFLECNEKEIGPLDMKASSKNDGRFIFEPKTLPEIEDCLMVKKIEPLESKALLENNMNTLAPMDQEKQTIPLTGISTDSNSTEMQIESLKSKESLEDVTMFPVSVAQGKKTTPLNEPSLDEKDGLLGLKKKEVESLGSTALLENDRRLKFEPKVLQEIEMRGPSSEVQEKLSMSLFESSEVTPVKKKIETLESKTSPENNKSLAPVDPEKQTIPSSGLSTHSNSTDMIEPFESNTLLENVTNFPVSVAQGKKSTTPFVELSVDANSAKMKIGPLDSKEKDTESLESKALLENNDMYSTSKDGNSVKKKIESLESKEKDTESLESKALLENNDMYSTSKGSSSVKKKIGSLELKGKDTESLESNALLENDDMYSTSEDASSVKNKTWPLESCEKNTESLESNALLENGDTHSTSISQGKQSIPLVEPSMDSNSMKKESGELESDMSSDNDIKSLASTVQRKQDSPSRDPLPVDAINSIKKKTEPQTLQVAVELTTQSEIISPQDHAPVGNIKQVTQEVTASTPSSISSTSDSTMLKSVEPSSTSVPPTSSSTTLLPSKVDALSAKQKTSQSFVPPPPPPPHPQHEPSSKLMQPIVTKYCENAMHDKGKKSLVTPPPPPPPPATSLSTVKVSFKGPPPPPLPPCSTGKTSPCSIPPPPPAPRHCSTTPAPTLTALAPPPPPPPLSKNSDVPVKPVPPPPSPPTTKSDTALPQPHAPPVPGPPGVPFGAKGRGLFRANPKGPSQTKRSNLKPYHWLKLTRAVHGSLWAETQKLEEACRAPEFDMSELESLFSAAAPNSDHGKEGNSNHRTSRQKVDKVQLIELRRAYNCEIMLTKVKIPLPDLMSAVLAMDDSVLYVDQVENLIKFCPTKEEMEQLKGYTGDKDNLGKCEQFFLEMMKVPRVENKLRVFSFKMQFCSEVKDLRRDLNIVNSASEEIRNSVKLKRIMQTILSLGNALNHGTARGSAIGFRLDSLLKLTDTRARNNKMTLMHYLCKVLAEKLAELLDFPKDLLHLEGSTKIQLKYLAEEMQAISKGLEKVVQELTASENDGPVSECFCQILKEFLSDAESEVRSLAQLYANVGRNADALALYFGEDPARVPFEQVVSTLLNFVKMFIRAHDENCKQIEYEKKRAEKEAEKLAGKKDSEHMKRSIKSGNNK